MDFVPRVPQNPSAGIFTGPPPENCGAPPGKSRTIPQAAAVLRRKLLNSYKFPIIFDLHLEFYGQIR